MLKSNETKKVKMFLLVYLFIKLTLILSVVITSVKGTFSAMSFVNNCL